MIEQLRKDLTLAMRDKDKLKKEVLGMVITGIVNKEKDIKFNFDRQITEAEEFEVIAKEVKQMKESIRLTPVDRVELIEANEYKIQFLEAYLPKQMSEEEIIKEIEVALHTLSISKPKPSDKGKLMGKLMPAVKGKADGALVNELVMKALNN